MRYLAGGNRAIAVMAALAAASLVHARSLPAQRISPTPPSCTVAGERSAQAASASARSPAAWTVAVLAFDVRSGTREAPTFASSLASAIARRLGSTQRIAVRDREVQSRRISPAAPAADVRALGRELGSRLLLTGTVEGPNDATTVTLALFDVERGERVWTRGYRAPMTGALAVERAASLAIAAAVLDSLTARERRALERIPTRNAGAYAAYLQGFHAASLLPRPDLARAATEFRAAVAADPRFAEAHAALALAYATAAEEGIALAGGGTLPIAQGLESAERAIRLDSALARGWLARARLLDLNRAPEARAAFARALALDPRDADIQLAHGVSRLQAGDQSAGAAALRRAASLAPGRALPLALLAEQALMARRDGEACSLLNRAILADALQPQAWALRGLLRARHDDLRFAWADAEIAERLGGRVLGGSVGALIDMAARDTTRARSRLRALWSGVRSRGSIGVLDGRYLAFALLSAGEDDQAIGVLERVRPRGPALRAVLGDPRFATIRRSPRVAELAASVAAPAAPARRTPRASRAAGPPRGAAPRSLASP